MRTLGIESSCDESAVAIYDSDRGLLGHQVYSQIELHAPYGGVVPELASRDHIRRLLPMIRQQMAEVGLSRQDIDGIAYTAGPGLIGALLVGAAIGRSLAWAWGIPAIAVHHMEAHLLAPMLEAEAPAFPFLALLVSGGHCQLVRVAGVGRYQLLGDTLDDAVGEAFDKTAKLLGLSYPGGPALAELAKQGNKGAVEFTRPMVNRPGLDFSFSGLKTAAINALHQNGDGLQSRADIAYAFQETVVDTLLIKCRRALKETGLTRLVVAGGVGANRRLREQLLASGDKLQIKVFFPRPDFCTDNGAMIAYAGTMRLIAGQHEPLSFSVRPRWTLDTLPAVG